MNWQLQHAFLIFFGCGIGGLLRYWIAMGTYLLLGSSFPYGTMIVNVSGSLLAGLMVALLLEHFGEIGPHLRAFLLIGFLGGYTTFSTFSVETVALLEAGKWLSASTNIILGVGAAWLGILLGKNL